MELIPEPFAFAAAGFVTAGLFTAALLALGFAALIGCRSRRESSASVFEAVFGALVAGDAVDDLPLAGIADFGVSGLVATRAGSGPVLADVV